MMFVMDENIFVWSSWIIQLAILPCKNDFSWMSLDLNTVYKLVNGIVEN